MSESAARTDDRFYEYAHDIIRHRRRLCRPPVYISDGDAIGEVAMLDETVTASTQYNEVTPLLSWEKQRVYNRYCRLIEGFSDRSMDEPLTDQVSKRAKALLMHLLRREHTPKIAPDEGGSLVLAYSDGKNEYLITIEDDFLHVILENEEGEFLYDDIVFDGQFLPSCIS